MASTNTVLRSQLINFFETDLPLVLKGCSGAYQEGKASTSFGCASHLITSLLAKTTYQCGCIIELWRP